MGASHCFLSESHCKVKHKGVKGGGTFNIFNISPVLSTFRKKKKKHLTFPLFRESTFTKQGKC